MAKSLLTPVRTKLILDSVRQGNSYKVASQAAGIDNSTISKWIKRGETEKSGPFFNFINDLKIAEAEGEQSLLKTIQDASKKNWTAAAWILERRYPERWARKDRMDLNHSGEVGVIVNVPKELIPQIKKDENE